MANKLKARIVAGAMLTGAILTVSPARGGDDLLGPLRIRDMTPFNLLRLELRPAHAVTAAGSGWWTEADLSYSNTFVMSRNVAAYLEQRGTGGALTPADADAIFALGTDAYYLDGEIGRLDLTAHYQLTPASSVHMTLSALRFAGGFLDGSIEGFHAGLGFSDAGRDLVARDRFQVISAIGGVQFAALDLPLDGGIGDPVIGFRTSRRLWESRWALVLTGEAKLALSGERVFLSTGSNDYGVQAALQGKFERQAVYVSTGLVSTDGQVFGVRLARRILPTVTVAYERRVAQHSTLIFQVYASQSAGRDALIPELRANKYEASLGLRRRVGRATWALALTENLQNYENTPDIGVSLNFIWLPAGA